MPYLVQSADDIVKGQSRQTMASNGKIRQNKDFSYSTVTFHTMAQPLQLPFADVV